MENIKENDKYLKRKEALTSFFSDKNYKLLTMKQIAVIFNVKKNELNILENVLNELVEDGIVYIDDSKRYVPLSNSNFIKCKYQAKSTSFGFGIVENGEDIYISSNNLDTAMDGDDVLVEITVPKGNSSKSREGRIVKILKRSTSTIIGRFIKSKSFGFVEPIDKKINDIYIPKKYISSAKENDFVEVKIEKYATNTSKAEGKILRVIGNMADTNIEVKALYASYALDKMEKFNIKIEEELKSIPDEVLDSDMINRVDRTSDVTVTIDSEDAKDLDDAVSVKKLENGNYMLSVYIADVSHYVRENTELNKEAIYRGTSIYIPGTVIPMLPKKLSNGICSLNAGVKRLALGVDMEIDLSGNVISSDVFKALIKVSKKMTYEKVYKVLINEDEEVLKEYEKYKDNIFLMREIASILNKKRVDEGSINFDIPETKVVLDENGEVIDIKAYEITIANKIIEEFMLVTNMTIAEKFFFLDMPFIYRIHETPDEEKLRDLNEILSMYKKRIKGVKNLHPKVLSEMLESIEDESEKKVISDFTLRTLKLARYSNECLGHFGLAAKYYCHFTSPIRRYPDLFIHRIISKCIESNYMMSDKDIAKYMKQAEKYAKSSSDTEKQSTIIERDFDNLYTALYMSRFIGKEYEAVISSVTSFGMFVKLDNTVEGLVSFPNICDGDYYIFDEKKHILIGERSGKIYKVGDKVRVILDFVNVRLKQIDFAIYKR